MTFKEWQDAATLQFTVYGKFLEWLRKNHDFDTQDILQLMNNDHYREEYERMYYKEQVE